MQFDSPCRCAVTKQSYVATALLCAGALQEWRRVMVQQKCDWELAAMRGMAATEIAATLEREARDRAVEFEREVTQCEVCVCERERASEIVCV